MKRFVALIIGISLIASLVLVGCAKDEPVIKDIPEVIPTEDYQLIDITTDADGDIVQKIFINTVNKDIHIYCYFYDNSNRCVNVECEVIEAESTVKCEENKKCCDNQPVVPPPVQTPSDTVVKVERNIAPVMLCNRDGVIVRLVDIQIDEFWGQTNYVIEVENKSGQDIAVTISNAVMNGYMFPDASCYTECNNNCKAIGSIWWNNDTQFIYGIREIEAFSFNVDIVDKLTYEPVFSEEVRLGYLE